jgi:hypothetical protein
MEPIKDLGELQPTLDSLAAKGLIQYLTPPGRGSVVTHSLYLDREMEKVRREAGSLAAEPPAEPHSAGPAAPAPAAVARENASVPAAGPAELAALREELAALRREFDASRSELESAARDLRRELEDLNRQLGN